MVLQTVLLLGLCCSLWLLPCAATETPPGGQSMPATAQAAKPPPSVADQAAFLRTVDRIWELARSGRHDQALAELDRSRQQTTDAGQLTRLDAMRTVLLAVNQGTPPTGTALPAAITPIPPATSPAPALFDLGATTDQAWELARSGRLNDALALLAAARRQGPGPDDEAKLEALQTTFSAMAAAAQGAPQPPATPVDGAADGADYTRVLDEAWKLAAANRLDEALELIRGFQANAPDPDLAQKLEPIRLACVARRNEAYEATVTRARGLVADGKLDEALDLITTFQASTPYPDLAEAIQPMRVAYQALAEPAAAAKPRKGPAPRTAEPYPGSGLLSGADAKGLWQDPRFREQFVGSYAMTADVEPRTSADERRVLTMVFDLMGSDNTDAALDLIERLFAETPPPLEELGIMTEAMAKWELADAAAREAAAAISAAKADATSATKATAPGADSEDRAPKPTLYGAIRRMSGAPPEPAVPVPEPTAPAPPEVPAPPPPPRTILQNPSAAFALIAGNIRFQKGDQEAAEDWYTRAVQGFPTFMRAYKNLGMVNLQKGDFQDAIANLSRAMELGATDGMLYGLLAYAHTSVGNHLAAEVGYRNAILLQPANADWKLGLARALFGQSRFTDAIAVCAQLLDERPADATLWRLQARAYLALGQPAKAAENYEFLRAMGAADTESLNALGDIQLKSEAYDQAAATYMAALASDPAKTAASYIVKAKALARASADEEASQLLLAIEQAAGADLTAEQRKETLRIRAWVALRRGADSEQAKLLEEIVAIDPTDGEALIALGQYYGRSGSPEKAVFLYERAAGIDAVAARARIGHAQLLVQQSKYDEAIPLLKGALATEPRDDVAAYLKQVEAAAMSRR